MSEPKRPAGEKIHSVVGAMLMALLVLGMPAFGAWGIWSAYVLWSAGSRVEGVVISERTYRDCGFVRFLDSAGREIEFVDVCFSPERDEGRTVPVIYLEDDPEGSARVDWPSRVWMGPVFVGVALLVLGGAGLIHMVLESRAPRRKGPQVSASERD